MRPITIISSGGLATKLLDETSGRVGELRTLALPVSKPLHVHTQSFAPLGRLGIVKPHSLNETAVARIARIRHNHVVERSFFGATSRQSYDNHRFTLFEGRLVRHPLKAKRTILRLFFCPLQAGSAPSSALVDGVGGCLARAMED